MRNNLGQFTPEFLRAQWRDPEYRKKMIALHTGENSNLWKNAKSKAICVACGKEYTYYKSNHGKGKYCSMACASKCRVRIEKIRKALTGKKLSESHRYSLRISHLGKSVGANSPSWKGGVTDTALAIRWSSRYDLWRDSVFRRDGFTCQRCGVIGKNIIAHHKIRFSQILREYNIKDFSDAIRCTILWDAANGLTLCKSCHKREHSK